MRHIGFYILVVIAVAIMLWFRYRKKKRLAFTSKELSRRGLDVALDKSRDYQISTATGSIGGRAVHIEVEHRWEPGLTSEDRGHYRDYTHLEIQLLSQPSPFTIISRRKGSVDGAISVGDPRFDRVMSVLCADLPFVRRTFTDSVQQALVQGAEHIDTVVDEGITVDEVGKMHLVVHSAAERMPLPELLDFFLDVAAAFDSSIAANRGAA